MDSKTLVEMNVARHSGAKQGTVTMMRSMNDQPALQQRDVDFLFQLLALISDPKAAAARLSQVVEAQKSAEKAKAEVAEAQKVRAQLDAEIVEARKQNEAAMASDREQQQSELSRKHEELNSREKQLEQREADVGKLHAAASQAKEHWESKVRALNAAMSQSAA